MSKVFIVRFSRYSIYKVQCAFRSRGQLLHTSTSEVICQELFSSFFNFLRRVCISLLPLRTALIYYQIFPALSSFIFIFFHFLLRLFFHFLPRVWGAYFPPRTAAIAGMVYEPQGMMPRLSDPFHCLPRIPEPMFSAVP